MIQAFFDMIRSLWRGPLDRAAQGKLQDARLRILASENGLISCPFHQDEGQSCRFNKKANSFHCDGCKRSGTMDTLQKRLNDPDVYTGPVV